MGIKKFFKPKAELTEDEEYRILDDKGLTKKVTTTELAQRKFKFQEFATFAKEGATKQATTLRPKNWQSEAEKEEERLKKEQAQQQQYQEENLNEPYQQQQQQHDYQQDYQQGYQQDQEQHNQSAEQYQTSQTQLQRQKTKESVSAPSYHTVDNQYDPYAQQQHQVQQQQAYDPYAPQHDVIEEYDEPDFNDYPGAAGSSSQQVQQEFDPYAPQEAEQEIDSEEEEIGRIVRHTKDVREATVKSSNNILNHLRNADDTATNTIGVLGAQREKLYETESKLNEMESLQRHTETQITDLNHYRSSIFHVRTSNPFTKKKRIRAAEQKVLTEREIDRNRDSALSSDLYRNQNILASHIRDSHDPSEEVGKSELAAKYDYERRAKDASRYLTEDHDEEDERMEVEFSKNIDEASKLAQNLKKKAVIISDELDNHNAKMKNLSEKVVKVDDRVVTHTNRIRGI